MTNLIATSSTWSTSYTWNLDINIIQQYTNKSYTWTYIELWYQHNDWTYYIHKENLIDLFIVFFLVLLCLFTFFALTIKSFKLWKK